MVPFCFGAYLFMIVNIQTCSEFGHHPFLRQTEVIVHLAKHGNRDIEFLSVPFESQSDSVHLVGMPGAMHGPARMDVVLRVDHVKFVGQARQRVEVMHRVNALGNTVFAHPFPGIPCSIGGMNNDIGFVGGEGSE